MESVFIPPIGGFTLGEHTADLWLESSGSTPEDCALRSLIGLYHVMAQEFIITSSIPDSIVLDIRNPDLLVIDVLSEALFLFDSEGALMLNTSLTREDDDRWVLEFTRSKCRIPEGKGGVEVKAATYHDLMLEMKEGSWYSKVLLDL
ncbi:MAG: archease [Candidatus Thermoplasmatota archaeon]|nr:archease [Candidatus Thermoplasmatota archaeon]